MIYCTAVLYLDAPRASKGMGQGQYDALGCTADASHRMLAFRPQAEERVAVENLQSGVKGRGVYRTRVQALILPTKLVGITRIYSTCTYRYTCTCSY